MDDQVFVVLRVQGDTVQTIGPAGQAFATFKEADAFARQLRDRFTQQTFYLCQVSAVYEVQGRATVKKIAVPESSRKQSKVRQPKTDEIVPEPGRPNIYPMPSRVRAAE